MSENVLRCDRPAPSDRVGWVPPDEAGEDPSPAELEPEAMVCPDCASAEEEADHEAAMLQADLVVIGGVGLDSGARAGCVFGLETAGMDDDDPDAREPA